MPGVGSTHHVKVGDQFLLIRPNSYRKKPAPLFGPRFTTGDPDYNNLSLWQHWAQTCWVGGLDADTWIDDAMYDEAVGVNTTTHERATLTRDLGPNDATRASANWNMGGSNRDREFFYFPNNSTLYLIEYGASAKLWKLNTAGDGSWTLVATFAEEVRSISNFWGQLVFGTSTAILLRMTTDEVFTPFSKPAGVTDIPYVMRYVGQTLFVSFGRSIWKLKTDFTWDGSTVFWDGVGIDLLVAGEGHLGFVYFASRNGHIIRTDGNNTFDLWQFEAGVEPVSMRSFDGKLFVATIEQAGAEGGRQGVLYMFTGAAVTELKRFGADGVETTLGRLRTAFRRLFYGASSLLGLASGFGVSVYDPIEDGHSIWATNRDSTAYAGGTNNTSWAVDDVMYFGGWLYCSVRGHGIFRTRLFFRDEARNLAGYEPWANGGWLASSDFDAGTPGLLKLWRQAMVHCDLPSTDTSIELQYSVDGGATYVSAGTATKTLAGTRYATRFSLNNIQGTRLKYKVILKSTDSTKTPVLLGVVISYLPLPEPNWMWEFRAVISERQQLLDDTTVDVDPSAVTEALESYFRDQNLVSFTDIDGLTYASNGPGALVFGLEKYAAFVGPTSDGDIEVEVALTIIEAAEAYE